MKTKERIILETKAWKQEKLSIDREYFQRLSTRHRPKILWICSSDSLASIREMTNTEPGDILVYRNLGALVRDDDMSLMAVLEAAVEIHEITHIIVCGYSQCSAISEVLNFSHTAPAVKHWLAPLRQLYEANAEKFAGLSQGQSERLLSEISIKQQVINLSHISCIQKAWEKRDYPRIFGWYFDLQEGNLSEVFSLEDNHSLRQRSTIAQNGSGVNRIAS